MHQVVHVALHRMLRHLVACLFLSCSGNSCRLLGDVLFPMMLLSSLCECECYVFAFTSYLFFFQDFWPREEFKPA